MPTSLRLLVVEDSADDVELLVRELVRGGYDPLYHVVETAEGLDAALDGQAWDLVIADYTMPHFSGTGALSVVRRRGLDVPFIFVSGTLGEDTAVDAMRAGAQDYVVKDSLKRLLPAIERELQEAAERRERRRAERALRDSEERFRQLAENIKEAFFIVELSTGRNLYVSPAWAEIWGRPVEDAYDHPGAWLETVHPEDRPRVVAGQSALARGEPDIQVFRVIRPDGSMRWVKGRAFPVRDDAGTVYRLVGLAEDVTEEHRAAEALKASELRYRSLVEGSLQAVMIHREGTVVFANQAAAALAGYPTAQELVGSSIWAFVAPEERARVESYRASRKEDEAAPAHFEFRATRADGAVAWVDCAVARITWEAAPAVLVTMVDVTKRRKLESQYLQAQKMEAVGQLAGGVAHDFNNILTVITGYADLLRLDRPPRRGDVEEISRAADRAAGLTRQLLAFSRQQVLQPRVIDLNEVLRGLEKMLRRLIDEDIELDSRLMEPLPGVHADPGQVEQVVLNLTVNARDAMPKGGRITIETSVVQLDEGHTETREPLEPGRYVLLAMTDNGTGMDELTRNRIFEPFFTTKAPGKGTGLGLATVYGIVKQSGGHVAVYSEVGRGATFKIYLPAVAKGELLRGKRNDRPVKGGTETVLLVEDEPGVRKLAHQVLERYGYIVLQARDGAEALELCRTHTGPIHLMLTDVVMPRMGGPESAEQLKAIRPSMKVLFMSGYANRAVSEHRVIAPDAPFLQKPFTPTALARKIRETLDD